MKQKKVTRKKESLAARIKETNQIVKDFQALNKRAKEITKLNRQLKSDAIKKNLSKEEVIERLKTIREKWNSFSVAAEPVYKRANRYWKK